MKLDDLGKREMAIIYIVGFLLSAALLYKFVVSPEFQRYRTFKSQFGSQQQREMRAVTRRDALLEQYVELRDAADEMNKLLFNRAEADDFQVKLPKLSAQTGNELTSITPKESKALAPKNPRDPKKELSEEEAEKLAQLSEIAQMPIGVTIKGEYGNIIKLFRTLEDFKELMVVGNVGVSSGREDENEVETRFSLNLIHTRSDINAPASKVLAAIAAMRRAAEAPKVVTTAQQTSIKPPDRPTIPQGLTTEMEEKRAVLRSGSDVKEKGASKLETKIKYAVQIGAFNVAGNSEAVKKMLESRNYEPWVRPNMLTGQAPYYVLIGKFLTKAEARQFGDLMQRELSWVNEFLVKETVLDADNVLREVRTTE